MRKACEDRVDMIFFRLDESLVKHSDVLRSFEVQVWRRNMRNQ